jgi:cell division protein FtsA
MANKSKLAVGLDAGSVRTRCVICEVDDGRLRFLGAGSAPSLGWQRGRIADPNAVTASVRAAVQEAETNAQALVDSVVAGIGGPAVDGSQGRGVYEFSRPRELEANDLSYAVELASRVRLNEDRMLVHVLPQDFTLDGKPAYRRPVGVECSRVEANVQIITASAQEHQCLISALHQAHLAVEETVFEPVAAAYSAVLPDERTRGAALVDLGMHSTGVTIYDGEALVGAASLPISADHLTRDVTLGLRASHGISVSYEDAESLKREYGCAMLGLTSDNTLIEVPSSEGRGMQEISRRQLNEILEARAEELFTFVRRELIRAGMENALLEGVFLTGGGARLNGMCDMAERVLNCPAKYGLAVGIDGWPQSLQDPAWATAAGLSMYSARLKLRRTSKKHKAPGLLGVFGW